ncbi:hypothetical protein, partial [Sphingobacterium multivorum]|uniref:hypothetical protein n=2 Tax=Bacteroidota/Chlorobiota group TaxID=68336 RepID=UPI0028AA9526
RTGGTSTAPTTGFRLDDGNQNPGYVLTAVDNNGVGTWKPSGMSMLVGTFVNSTNNIPFSASPYVQTGASITLPPGLWRVDLTQLIRGTVNGSYTLPNDAYALVRFSLSESNATTSISLFNDFVRLQADGTVANSSAQLVSTTFEGPVTGSTERHWKTIVATGSMTIRNNSSANKTYYLVTHVLRTNIDVPIDNFAFRNLGSSYWGENSMYAIPIVAL